jgi:hypothetical protein
VTRDAGFKLGLMAGWFEQRCLFRPAVGGWQCLGTASALLAPSSFREFSNQIYPKQLFGVGLTALYRVDAVYLKKQLK